MLRKRSVPIWMYIERFYENENHRFFSNFASFFQPYGRLRPKISSQVTLRCFDFVILIVFLKKMKSHIRGTGIVACERLFCLDRGSG